MYLDTWMIVAIIISFGVCAVYNRRAGFNAGGTLALSHLVEKRIIKITEDGEITRY